MWKGTWNILFAFSRLYSNGLRARINSNPTVLFFQVIRFVHVGANPMNWVILVGEQPHAWCSMLGCTLVTQVNEPFAFLTSSVFLHHCLFCSFLLCPQTIPPPLSQAPSPAARAPTPVLRQEPRTLSTRSLPTFPVPQRTEFLENSVDQPAL